MSAGRYPDLDRALDEEQDHLDGCSHEFVSPTDSEPVDRQGRAVTVWICDDCGNELDRGSDLHRSVL